MSIISTSTRPAYTLTYKTKLIKLMLLVIITLIVFVMKAYIKLPILQRGITAWGLYDYFNPIQFKETFIFTFLIILYIAFKKMTIRLRWAFALAFAAACGNAGLMIIDARYQTYLPYIEASINDTYGTPTQIYQYAIGLLVIAVIIGIGALFANIEDKQRAQKANHLKATWHYKVGFMGLVFLGLFVELFI